MRLSVLAATTIAVAAFPAVPALAHCRTVHHRVHHVRHVAVRRHVVHYAGCACRTHVAYRHAAYRRAAYPVVYRRPRVVEVTYERPLYRPYPVVYEEPIYRPHPYFYGARFGGPRFHRWHGYGFDHRGGFEHRGGFGHGFHRGWR
jgi:hypothetical protein